MLISIDPGYNSGTCIVDSFDAGGNFNVTACLAIDWSNRFYYYEYITTHGKAIDAIIIERFKLTGDPDKLRTQFKSEMPSSRVIGLIEAAAYSAGIFDRIVFQEPADRFNVRILPQHYALVGPIKHNQDAYRHMHYYIRMHRVKI